MICKMRDILLKKADYLDLKEQELLVNAIEYADRAHLGQKRGTGEPYIIHPISVCEILTVYKADITTLISALLHDVVEDTNVSLSEIENIFGSNVALIVDGLTKVDKGSLEKDEYSAINTEKLLSTSVIDIRVAIVKIADRLHNMRTLSVKRAEKKASYANETLVFFSPLSEKLGLYKIQEELEELGFKYLNPSQYKRISKILDNYTNIFINIVNWASKKLMQRNINAMPIKITWRKEPIYKSYSLLQEDNSLSELYRIEVITDSTLNCYTALGLIHGLFDPIPNQFNDNIAIKKSLYSNQLITKVLFEGIEVKFEIKAKSSKKFVDTGIFNLLNKKLSNEDIKAISNVILKDSIKAVKSITNNPIEFYDLITYELLQKEITVLTPKMDVILLPEGSTVIDFAFHLNTTLAKKMSYARVNGETKDLNFVLSNMDIVEVITSNNITVNSNWLNHALTSKAQQEINTSLLD
ncbi:HD domain-containing protein [Bacillus salitolerans]|uniref:HD domain-containing protein n=1 Tax=Bacillus salitolerans TaxID=1437434 RepID=A0ABW4LPR8_9BACI